MDAAARQQIAIEAAYEVAARHGIGGCTPTVIKDSNNTIVDLGAANLVAKVATTTLPGHTIDTELAVLLHLHGRRAPTSRLSDRVEHCVHEARGCRLLFLDRLELLDEPVAPAHAVAALRAAHDALVDLRLPVHAFDDTLATTGAIFGDKVRTPTLPDDERRYCLAVGSRLREQLDATTWEPHVLHGDPWIGGNLVNTTTGPALLDFEAVCTGPIEWDLSALAGVDDATLDLVGVAVDSDVLTTCRALRSFTVAAWCWAQPGRAPEVDQAARWHLQLLHATFGT